MYMAPPFLAVAGRPVEAVKQIEGMRRLLWNPEKRLFSHIWDDGRHDFERKDFWGVGNGWAAGGMSRVIRSLPTEMTGEKARLVGYVKDVIDGCLACQRPDGLFHDVLDNPQTFVETNLAQMLAYSIYRGLLGGWLGKIHLKQADRMRKQPWRKSIRSDSSRESVARPNFLPPESRQRASFLPAHGGRPGGS